MVSIINFFFLEFREEKLLIPLLNNVKITFCLKFKFIQQIDHAIL